MSWAARRRATILAIVGGVILLVLALLSFKTFYRAPSCTDGAKDQGEAGIDCGGPCQYLCQSQVEAPVVRFTQTFAPEPGKTDVIAYIDNPNQSAYALGATYQVVVYGPDHVVVARPPAGILDLPPGATVPVFIPNLASGNQAGSTAFLTIDPSSLHWQQGSDSRTLPTVGSSQVTGSPDNPRITVTLSNPSASTMQNVAVVTAVFDAAGNVIAASQTLLPSIAAQDSSVATFTWNTAFSAAPARVDVFPLVPLSSL